LLAKFFAPESVAVVGASRNPRKVGYQIVLNLLKSGFKGRIYPVNPNADEILGLKAYPSVSSIPEPVDLAVIAVPAPAVPGVIEDCGAHGVKAAIVISAGFREVGNVELEKRVVETARRYGMRVMGPNCVGVYVPKTGLNTTFLSMERMGFPSHGPIAFISQSGAFGVAVLDWASMRGVGISKFVSLGNKADLDESDVLLYLAEDEDTRVVTMYIEGVEKGRGERFVKALREVTPRKPVVALKSGRSEAGARAIASHTGSLAGSDAVYDAVFKQTGVVRAMGMEDLFDMALALAFQPPASGRRVAILTVGGGSGVMATDACSDLGLKVPRLSHETEEKLRRVLLPIASPHNPVDVTGSATDQHLVDALEILLRSGEVDAVIWIPYFQVPGITEGLVKEFVARYREVVSDTGRAIPVVGAVTGGDYTWRLAREAERLGIPMYPSVERAAKAVWALYRYGSWLRRLGVYESYVEGFLRKGVAPG